MIAAQKETSKERTRISSPASTGGAGTFFEQHVGAFWLTQLLVRGIPPVLHDCCVMKVCLQTNHLGWQTDDFLIVGQNGIGNQRMLAGQVKRTFTVSATDEECKTTIGDFWRDFRNSGLFTPAFDRFALVTQRGSNTLLEHFAGLLDCARAARHGAEFEHRLTTPGFISKKAAHYCQELKIIIGEIEGRRITAAELWSFLRLLHILSLDLNTSTKQTESMVKTLLAHTTTDSHAVGAADTSWDTLLAIAADSMAAAHSILRNDLPVALRQRHSAVSGAEHKALRALKDHSELILRGIRSTIGNVFHLERAGLVQQVLEQLESHQVVLVSGPAGSGKSAVAKDAMRLLSADYFAFCFRAEEFAQPHFDATLQNAQIPANATTLEAILAGQVRKVLLIESVERLLEKSTRDAFSDLLTQAAADKSLRIVLTCRDYSTDLVRASFLAFANIGHSVITIPQLDDAELAEVETSIPALARPLANLALRRILRNPYFLDKALRISWSADRPLPESEREFRAVFWQEIVCASSRTEEGAPRRREKVFEEIAVQRARALTAYVNSNDLDPAVVSSLRQDSLIASSGQNTVLVAPAHDVLEDWAILQWIEEQHFSNEGSVRGLSEAIGNHPAIRRTYRKWVAELIERDPGAAGRLYRSSVSEAGIQAQFRDDTLVSLLQSPSSPTFLEGHISELLADNRVMFRRVIHLLRVACVTASEWSPDVADHGSLFNLPSGPAWATVLRLVQTHIQQFNDSDHMLLLGLIEDWARGVSWRDPYPQGAESAAAIAHCLLSKFDTYRSEGAGRRTLKVIAKIPMADTTQFADLLQSTDDVGERERMAGALRELIFSGLDGIPAARDLPDLVISVATEYLLNSEEKLQNNSHGRNSLRSESEFGLHESIGYNYSPASALQGPWVSLLKYHPKHGVDFLITLFNHSAEWYAHRRVEETIEPPFEIELLFADGTIQRQWCNQRLWNWHRGTSVGPGVLQSTLMALEMWLLGLAEVHPASLDAILLNLLQRSTSAAISGVVASVATAFPHASGETLLVFLRSPICIWLDRQRMVAESDAPSRLSGLLVPELPQNRPYEMERKQADDLPHRRHDLEAAIRNIQLGPLAPSVHKILDEHKAALPAALEQTDRDRQWRLSMHRMDLRRYTATIVNKEVSAGQKATEPIERQIRLEPEEPESDVKDMVDESAAKLQAMNTKLALLMWAQHTFRNEDPANYNPQKWPQKLKEARTLESPSHGDEESAIGSGAPGFVAAVCIRDHWEEMSDDARDWCSETVVAEIMRQTDVWNELNRVQRHSISADRPCSFAIAALIGKSLSDAQRQRVEIAFVNALTHPTNEVRWYAAHGVAKYLWIVGHELALRCVNAIATVAMLVERARATDRELPYDHRRPLDMIEAEAALTVRQRFWQAGEIPDSAYQNLDSTTWFGAEATSRILTILIQAPAQPVAIAGFKRAAQTLAEWWNSDNTRSPYQNGRHRERNHETESAISRILQSFIIQTSPAIADAVLQPILDCVDRHPRNTSSFFIGLINAEDRQPNPPQFWCVWELFANSVKRARWLGRMNAEYATCHEMISAIFLGPWWKERTRHWKSLEGHEQRIHSLFTTLPPSSVATENYVQFLYLIGEQSLPTAFVFVAKQLNGGNARLMFGKTNTIYMLEVLLQRHVYGRPLELKSNKEIRDAVLELLDALVDAGSSAAYRMRDDFVTPVPS